MRPLALLLLATALAAALPALRSANAATPCPGDGSPPADAEADALMASVEQRFRRGARVVRMDIRTTYQRKGAAIHAEAFEPKQRTLWGVFDGQVEESHLLYVFSGPGRLAGTALLMHDRADGLEGDSTWLYLRSFDIFKRVEAKDRRVLVPGTALTYEDSRGFIPTDKYRFRFSAPGDTTTAPGSVAIVGCPRTAALSEELGYRSLKLQVDPEKWIVRRVDFMDVLGRPQKSYTLRRETRIGDRFFPLDVELVHAAEGFTTDITYEYWLPDEPPPVTLFAPDLGAGRFIDRLQSYLDTTGQGARLRAERAEAAEVVRQFEDKLRRIQESERSGSHPGE